MLFTTGALVACEAQQEGEVEGRTVTVGEGAEADVEVELRQFAFRPEEVAVAVGETVEFANGDDTLHTVTSGGDADADGELFDEALDGRGARVRITFQEPGAYAFFCRPHDFMSGTVTVAP